MFVTCQGSLVRVLDWHHVAWCVKTWALTTLNLSIIEIICKPAKSTIFPPEATWKSWRQVFRGSVELNRTDIWTFPVCFNKEDISFLGIILVPSPDCTGFTQLLEAWTSPRWNQICKPVHLDYRLVIFLPGKLFVWYNHENNCVNETWNIEIRS